MGGGAERAGGKGGRRRLLCVCVLHAIAAAYNDCMHVIMYVIDHTGRAVAWHDQARAQAWPNNIEGATKAGSSDASVPEAVHKVGVCSSDRRSCVEMHVMILLLGSLTHTRSPGVAKSATDRSGPRKCAKHNSPSPRHINEMFNAAD
eukprot:SAG25_NODE_95_length_15927_cov_8.666224_18_plen_147_part_00